MAVDPLVMGVGRQAHADAGRAGSVEQRENPGEHGLSQHQLVLAGPTFQLERGPIGVLAEPVPRIERVIGVPHAPEKQRPIERHAVSHVHFTIRVDQRRFGVENQPIEIENDRANHVGEFIRRYSQTSAGFRQSRKLGARQMGWNALKMRRS